MTEDLKDVYNQLFPGKIVTPLVFGSCGRNIELNNAYICESTEKLGYPRLFRTDYAMSADYLEENVKIKFGKAPVEGIAFNRNGVLEDGTYVTHVRGKENVRYYQVTYLTFPFLLYFQIHHLYFLV